jgi:hypothetical protein
LEKLLIRGIRRSLGRFGSLKYGEKLLIIEPFIPEHWFPSVVMLIYKAVKKHRNRITVGVFLNSAGKIISSFLDNVDLIDLSELANIDLLVKKCFMLKNILKIFACFLKIEITIGVALANLNSFKNIAVTRSRSLVPKIAVIGALLRDPSILVEALSIREINSGLYIINPIHNIPDENIAGYSFLSETYNNGFHISGDILDTVESIRSSLYGLIDIVYRSRELAFSTDKSIEFIQERLLTDYSSRCRYCGSKIPKDQDLCEYCRLLTASFYNLSKPSR